MKATRAVIAATGGPDVIGFEEIELPPPGPGEVTIDQGAIGFNFIDTYHRSGLYPVELPSGLGLEAAGTVVAVGEGVRDVAQGMRVATLLPPLGAYASARNYPADLVVAVPDAISDELAAAAILKAATVEFLVERAGAVQPNSTALVHAGAGGVGQLMLQWLHAIGVRTITTVSTAEKAELARKAGADAVIDYTHEDVAERVAELTDGKGVETVFDGVGADTFAASLKSLTRFGMLVSYGNASGPVTGVDLGQLSAAGSVFVTRPTLMHYYADKAMRDAGAARVWEMFEKGALTMTIGQTYALRDAAQAHADLVARKTVGSTVLKP